MIQRFRYELAYILKRTPWDTEITPPELMSYLDTHPPGCALDLGCGTGTNAITMVKRGWHVTAVDISSQAIRRAVKKARNENVEIEFLQQDVTQLDRISDRFDLALDIGCLHGLPPEARTRYAAQLDRRLLPTSTYLLYTWLQSKDTSKRWFPSEADIRSTFSPFFTCQDISHGMDGKHPAAWFTFKRKN